MIIYLTQRPHRYSCQSGVQDCASTVRVYARPLPASTQGQPVASVGGWKASYRLSSKRVCFPASPTSGGSVMIWP